MIQNLPILLPLFTLWWKAFVLPTRRNNPRLQSHSNNPTSAAGLPAFVARNSTVALRHRYAKTGVSIQSACVYLHYSSRLLYCYVIAQLPETQCDPCVRHQRQHVNIHRLANCCFLVFTTLVSSFSCCSRNEKTCACSHTYVYIWYPGNTQQKWVKPAGSMHVFLFLLLLISAW